LRKGQQVTQLRLYSAYTAYANLNSGLVLIHVSFHWIFSEVHVRYMLSPVRLSVCRLSVTLVRPTQAVEIFGNIFTALGTSATH